MSVRATTGRRGRGAWFAMLGAALALSGCAANIETPGSANSTVKSAVRSKYPEPVDLARARAACLERSGWNVSVGDDAAITADLTPGTESDYRRDDDDCLKQLGIDPEAPPTSAQLRDAYDDSLKGAECLQNGGWATSPAPTFETFADTYDTAPWYPWAEVPDEDFTKAVSLCPTPEPTY